MNELIAKVLHLEEVASIRGDTDNRDYLSDELDALNLGSLSRKSLVAVCVGLGRRTNKDKAGLIDTVRRVVLERNAQLHSADS